MTKNLLFKLKRLAFKKHVLSAYIFSTVQHFPVFKLKIILCEWPLRAYLEHVFASYYAPF